MNEPMETPGTRGCVRARSKRAALLLGATLLVAASGAAVTHADGPVANDANDWPMYNHDVAGTRYNAAEKTLKAGNVGGLHVLWQYPTPAPVAATPVVAGGVIYAGDMAGIFYALREDGSLLWATQVGPGSIMYCAGNVLHGIVNTGKVPMTFYWSKWLAKGF